MTLKCAHSLICPAGSAAGEAEIKTKHISANTRMYIVMTAHTHTCPVQLPTNRCSPVCKQICLCTHARARALLNDDRHVCANYFARLYGSTAIARAFVMCRRSNVERRRTTRHTVRHCAAHTRMFAQLIVRTHEMLPVHSLGSLARMCPTFRLNVD